MVIKANQQYDINEALKIFKEIRPNIYFKGLGNRIVTVVREDNKSTVIEATIGGESKSWVYEDRGHFQTAMEFAKYLTWLE